MNKKIFLFFIHFCPSILFAAAPSDKFSKSRVIIPSSGRSSAFRKVQGRQELVVSEGPEDFEIVDALAQESPEKLCWDGAEVVSPCEGEDFDMESFKYLWSRTYESLKLITDDPKKKMLYATIICGKAKIPIKILRELGLNPFEPFDHYELAWDSENLAFLDLLMESSDCLAMAWSIECKRIKPDFDNSERIQFLTSRSQLVRSKLSESGIS